MDREQTHVGETRIVTTRNEEGNDNTQYQERNQFFYHSDHLGSAQLVTDYRGRTYERIEYTPYGESWIEWKNYSNNNYETPFRFTGKERDEETGLYYYGARYMDAKTSRWLSTDPALGEYIPGAPINDEVKKANQNLPGMGGVFNTVNLHLYHYAGNNPVRYTDPTGRTDEIPEVVEERYIPEVLPVPDTLPSNWPIWPLYSVDEGNITSEFGPRLHPITGNPSNHGGLDIGAARGTRVLSVLDGVVSEIGYNDVYGNYIEIDHGNGMSTRYAHFDDPSQLQEGQEIVKGTVVGFVGNEGESTGPHLHFEYKLNGVRKDPMDTLYSSFSIRLPIPQR